MTATDTFRAIDNATRTVRARKAAQARADRIVAAVVAGITCDPDDFDAHIAGFDPDGAPRFAPCQVRCEAIA